MSVLNPFAKPKTPSIPTPPPPPPAPTMSDADVAAAQEQEKQKRAARAGRASTILTSSRGVMGDDSAGVATKKLLGG